MDIERSRRVRPEPKVTATVRKIRGIAAESNRAKVISFDEMWTYVGARKGEKRNSVWIWTAVVEERNGERWSDFEVGNRDRETFGRLLGRLPEAESYRSDAYEAYGCLDPGVHVVGKGGEVNRNEGLHSVLRGKLNRLVRKTKGYSKSEDMLVGSLAMVWLREGWI